MNCFYRKCENNQTGTQKTFARMMVPVHDTNCMFFFFILSIGLDESPCFCCQTRNSTQSQKCHAQLKKMIYAVRKLKIKKYALRKGEGVTLISIVYNKYIF